MSHDKMIDTARNDPCPNCGELVRQYGSGGWWCKKCLQQKCDDAVKEIKKP